MEDCDCVESAAVDPRVNQIKKTHDLDSALNNKNKMCDIYIQTTLNSANNFKSSLEYMKGCNE